MQDDPVGQFYRISARLLFGDPEHGDWIHERIRTLRSVTAVAANLLYYSLGQPRISNLVSIQLEPVHACNLRCKYCPRFEDTVRSRPRFMSKEIFRRVVDQLPPTVEAVQFALLGEPMMHPDLGEMIDYIHHRRRRAIMYTNGTLLRGDRLETLVRSAIDVVNVSVEMDAETFQEIRGVNLDDLRQNVLTFIERKSPQTEVKLSAVVHEHNIDRLPRLYEYWKDHIRHFKVFPAWSIGPPHPAPSCMELWRGNINVWSNGNVSPCCYDPDEEMIVGNVLEQSLAQIIRGNRMRQLMRDMLDGHPVKRCFHCYRYEGYTPGFHVRWKRKQSAG